MILVKAKRQNKKEEINETEFGDQSSKDLILPYSDAAKID